MPKYTKAEIAAEIKRRRKLENEQRLLELRKFTNAQLRVMLKEKNEQVSELPEEL